MNVPRYWSRVAARVARDGQRPLALAAWGWSSRDRAEAEAMARERLATLVTRVQHGQDLPRGYGYGTRPMREEIVEEFFGLGREVMAVITRTGYGSLVLNTARVMFVDVDLPPPRPAGVLRRLFGRRDADLTAVTRDRLAATLTGTGGSFRLYRTAAGFRVLATDPLYEPGSAAAEAVMRAVGADPAFVTLCRRQASFRARLTPKPWRCGQPTPPGQHPRETRQEQDAFAAWLRDYERACANLATCHFLQEIGPGRVHRDVTPVLRVHDERTRAIRSQLALA